MWLFALGNGTCEAVINPLTATLFPKNKTHWLNILHAGWPLGLILGALDRPRVQAGRHGPAPIRWEIKLGVFLVPVLLYGLMMFNRPFPHSEAKSAGVSLGTTMLTILSPILLFLFLLHALVGYVELGTDSWITNITERVLADESKALLCVHLDERADVHPAVLRRPDRPQDQPRRAAVRRAPCSAPLGCGCSASRSPTRCGRGSSR